MPVPAHHHQQSKSSKSSVRDDTDTRATSEMAMMDAFTEASFGIHYHLPYLLIYANGWSIPTQPCSDRRTDFCRICSGLDWAG